jgi:hypothetical protein
LITEHKNENLLIFFCKEADKIDDRMRMDQGGMTSERFVWNEWMKMTKGDDDDDELGDV